jgi:hypothetical protein
MQINNQSSSYQPTAFSKLDSSSPLPTPGIQPIGELTADSDVPPDELKEAFSDFVGQTFFGEMIKAFRTSQQPSKYFHGGRAEEIFQGQFDQVLTEKLSDASADKIADPMYELFMLKRSS